MILCTLFFLNRTYIINDVCVSRKFYLWMKSAKVFCKNKPINFTRCLLSVLVITASIYSLVVMIMFEWNVPYAEDAYVYFAVGRGMLNGLLPYVDMFEIKSPAIFLVAAASDWLFSDMTLMRILNIFVLIFLPLSMCVGAKMLCKKTPGRPFYCVIAFIIGVFFAICAEMSVVGNGGYRPEIFAFIFSVPYSILLLKLNKKEIRPMHVAISALLLLGSIGFFETNVLIMFAIAVLLCERFCKFSNLFLIPLVVALLLGTVFMHFSGYLQEYLHIYLPFILEHRMHEDILPLWIRAMSIDQFLNLIFTGYYSVFAGVSITLTLLILIIKPSIIKNKKQLSLSLLFLFVFSFFVWLIWKAALVTKIAEIHSYSVHYSTLWLVIIVLFLVLLYLASKLRNSIDKKDRKFFAKNIVCVLFVLYVICFALSTTGVKFSFSSLILPIPFFLAIFLLFLREASYMEHMKSYRLISGSVFICIFIGIFSLIKDPIGKQLHFDYTIESRDKYVAQQIDEVLYSCDISRYFIYGSFRPFGFTKHSPYGPAICPCLFQKSYEFEPLRRKLYDNLYESDFIVVTPDKNYMPSNVINYIISNFTPNSWECAESVSEPQDVFFFFRKNLG